MSPDLLDSVLLRTDFPELKLHASGKVRDVYDIDDEQLLFVASDRISAFDYILATGIPHKGRVLTQISLFWFDFLAEVVPNHLITADVDKYPAVVRKYADQLRGRSMLVRKAEMFPVECVVRGYISGSAWKEYKASGKVCGHHSADWLEGVRRVSRTDLHAVNQGDDRSRRKYLVRSNVRLGGRRECQPFKGSDAARYTRRPRPTRASAASSLPTQSSSLAGRRAVSR